MSPTMNSQVTGFTSLLVEASHAGGEILLRIITNKAARRLRHSDDGLGHAGLSVPLLYEQGRNPLQIGARSKAFTGARAPIFAGNGSILTAGTASTSHQLVSSRLCLPCQDIALQIDSKRGIRSHRQHKPTAILTKSCQEIKSPLPTDWTTPAHDGGSVRLVRSRSTFTTRGPVQPPALPDSG